MSGLLLDEPLLCYQPALVRRFGLADAAIIQQLQFWSRRSTNIHEGERWVYKTYDDWSAEIGISSKAVRGALDRLRKANVVIAMQSPLDPRDKTLWWRINYDVVDGTSAPSPSGSPSAPQGSPPDPEGSSRAGVPDGSTKNTTETRNRRGAREDRKTQAPDGFPDELRPHAREVMRILQAVAADHPTAKAIWPREVGLVIMAFPRRPLVAAAHELARWAVDPPRPIKDVAATYRTFLKGERDLASTERLADDGTPTSAPAPEHNGNVHRLRTGAQRMSNAERIDAKVAALRGSPESNRG